MSATSRAVDVESAREAGLRYVNDDEPGYSRLRWGRGFTYRDADGDTVTDSRLRKRFEELVIPPAWTDVWICRDENGHMQASGRDAAGRKQYVYHERWEEFRNERKFEKLYEFGAEALPALRERYNADLRRKSLSRERVVAIALLTLDRVSLRIGNERYAEEYGSRGLTTVERDDVEASWSRVVFDFQGKSGQERHVEVTDRRLARQLRRCQELPGQRLFKYQRADGTVGTIESEDVNEYIADVTSGDFTAKDFRTWGGTVQTTKALIEAGPPKEDDVEERIREAIEAAADRLGNTVAVCREYYVHPAVLEAARDETLWAVPVDSTDIEAVERRVCDLLSRSLR